MLSLEDLAALYLATARLLAELANPSPHFTGPWPLDAVAATLGAIESRAVAEHGERRWREALEPQQ